MSSDTRAAVPVLFRSIAVFTVMNWLSQVGSTLLQMTCGALGQARQTLWIAANALPAYCLTHRTRDVNLHDFSRNQGKLFRTFQAVQVEAILVHKERKFLDLFLNCNYTKSVVYAIF